MTTPVSDPVATLNIQFGGLVRDLEMQSAIPVKAAATVRLMTSMLGKPHNALAFQKELLLSALHNPLFSNQSDLNGARLALAHLHGQPELDQRASIPAIQRNYDGNEEPHPFANVGILATELKAVLNHDKPDPRDLDKVTGYVLACKALAIAGNDTGLAQIQEITNIAVDSISDDTLRSQTQIMVKHAETVKRELRSLGLRLESK